MSDSARALTLERGNLNVYRALANADRVFTGWMAAGRAALTSTVLSARMRELVILRTATVMDCPYEITQHAAVGSAAGLRPREIAALLSDSSSFADDFDHAERAVVQLTTQLVSTRRVSAADLEAVQRALGVEATVEILMIISRWAGLALMLNALRVDIDESARLEIPAAG
jgi:AhpD family alkylhydroperoxidase